MASAALERRLSYCSLGWRALVLELVKTFDLGSICSDAIKLPFQTLGPFSDEIFHPRVRKTGFRELVDVASI